MTARFLSGAALGLALSAATASAALAQSYTAPAGIPATTAPGGLEGRAAAPNVFGTRGPGAWVGTPEEDIATGALRHRRGVNGVYVR